MSKEPSEESGKESEEPVKEIIIPKVTFPALGSPNLKFIQAIERDDDSIEIDAWGKVYVYLQRALRLRFKTNKAVGRLANPLIKENAQWPIKSFKNYLAVAGHFRDTVRVYYLPRYIHRDEIRELVSCVPAVCTDGDNYIIMQNGAKYANDTAKKIARSASLMAARANSAGGAILLSTEKRRRSRMKVIASVTPVFAFGGYGSSVKPLPKNRLYNCIIISCVGPQFEREYLDFADFIMMEDSMTTRLETYSGYGVRPKSWRQAQTEAEFEGDYIYLSATAIFDQRGFLISMCECAFLWLRAFDDMVRRVDPNAKGVLNLCAVGGGFFANLPTALGIGRKSISNIVIPLLKAAILIVVGKYEFPNIGALVWNDHTKHGLFRPRINHLNGIEMITAIRGDVLDFRVLSPAQIERYTVFGALNPSDCFAVPGNEPEYESVEAMIG